MLCSLKSSTVPTRMMRMPLNAEPVRNISVPQVEQKWLVMVLPDSIVLFWENSFKRSSPRLNFVCSSWAMKLLAKADAVNTVQTLTFSFLHLILTTDVSPWQSVQWHWNVSTSPGLVSGYAEDLNERC